MVMPRAGTLGIVRECYSKWERRAPLTPSNVAQLVKEGVRVLVQPCDRRVFGNGEYEKAGAEVKEDLREASAIFGVKQVPIDKLLPRRAYAFFSHTVKAQPENMALLDAIRAKEIRLFDYECITEGGVPGAARTVAFGAFAGRAGMLGGLRGLGERALNLGFSLPFLSLGSAYMYPNLAEGQDAVRSVGEQIRMHGLPKALAPFSVVFTGNGAASKGAREIFSLLPHTMVSPEELATLPPDPHRLFGCVVEADHMAARKDGGAFSKAEYYKDPSEYQGIFAQEIVPHATAIVHCSYWDARFPRLLTTPQLRSLKASGNNKLLGVVDVSCDIGGAFEMLTHSTHPEAPYYLHDTVTGQPRQDLSGEGVLMCGVDILPSELPREASAHFGKALLGSGVAALAQMDLEAPWEQAKITLSPSLQGACITADGKLVTRFEYIDSVRRSRMAHHLPYTESQLEGSTVLEVSGHLFDTGLLNKLLNLLETHQASFAIVDVDVTPNRAMQPSISTAWIQVSAQGGRAEVCKIVDGMRELLAVMPDADAKLHEAPKAYCAGEYGRTLKALADTTADAPTLLSGHDTGHDTGQDSHAMARVTGGGKTVLVLGAGKVAAPAVEMLSRDPSRRVMVVSGIEGEAAALKKALGRANVDTATFDCAKDVQRLEEAVQSADVTLSLLPATMHAAVAARSIKHSRPLVTASYVSDELRAMASAAAAANTPILGEMGLDPGMDHMSAMRLIDEARAAGGRIVSFRSVCGGLPAPESANNPLRYKFSWSPRGVLSAARNSAKFLEHGELITLDGANLLSHAVPFTGIPTMALESLPNRDATPYQEAYGLAGAHTVYRGTLRYLGTCEKFRALQKLGLLDDATLPLPLPATWAALVPHAQYKAFLQGCTPGEAEAVQWLSQVCGALEEEEGRQHASKLDALAAILERLPAMQYKAGERDMAAMQHQVIVEYDQAAAKKAGLASSGGVIETRTSQLVLYGDSKVGGDSAMAKCVGLTAAAGVELMMGKGRLSGGVHIPTQPEVYNPVLALLEEEGVVFQEEARTAPMPRVLSPIVERVREHGHSHR